MFDAVVGFERGVLERDEVLTPVWERFAVLGEARLGALRERVGFPSWPGVTSASALRAASVEAEVFAVLAEREHVKHIVRWSAETSRPAGAPAIAGVGGRTVTYIIPVPGTLRRKALVFTSTIVIPDGGVIPADVVDGIELLSDAMISTFAWEQLAEEPAVPAAAPGIDE